MRKKKIHLDGGGLSLRQLPRECIEECAAPGRAADPYVKKWREALGFTVDRPMAIRYLGECGAWSDEELATWDDARVAETILWQACGDFLEYLSWREDSPRRPARDADYGTNFFTLN